MNVELAKMYELAYKKELNTLIADECVCVCCYITEKSIPMKRCEPVFVDLQCTGYGD